MKVVIPQIYFSLSELLFHLMISSSLPEYNNYVLDLLTMYGRLQIRNQAACLRDLGHSLGKAH